MIVLDASAAVEISLSSELGLVLTSFIERNERVISCDLFRAETASVFRKFTRTEGLSAQDAIVHYNDALALVDDFVPLSELQDEAFPESIRLNHSTYDMFYFVLARRCAATLFTTDKKLMDLCAAHGVNCLDEVEW